MRTADRVNPKRLYRARLRANLSQADLAYALRADIRGGRFKPTERGIRRWESGENAPSADVVPALARVLRVSLDYLYGSEEDGDDDGEDDADVIRRVATELVHLGHDDMASDLLGVARRQKAAEAEQVRS